MNNGEENLFENMILLLTNFGKNLVDDNSEIIFLNQRCLSCAELVENKPDFFEYSERYDDLEGLERYQDEIFEEVMRYMSPVLSELNDVKYGKDYWKYYTSLEFGTLFWSYYAMYTQIKNVIEKYHGIKIVCFEDCEYDIAKLNILTIKYKSYMLQLIGKQILSALNYDNLEVKKIKLTDFFDENTKKVNDKKTWKIRDILRTVYDWAYKCISKKANCVVTYSFTNNIRSIQRQLIGKVYFSSNIKEPKISNKDIDIKKRNIFFKKMSRIFFEDEFENIFVKNISNNLSLNYIENYHAISYATKDLKKMKAKMFVKFLYNPVALEYGAYVKENGGKVVECSHSIEEGWRLWNTLSMKEADCFFAWSKAKYLSHKKYIECISYMLNSIKRVNYMDNENILYARGQETSPYPEEVSELILDQRIDMLETVLRPVKFYDELETDIKKCMLYRNRDEWGEGSREIVESYCPNVTFDDSFANGRQISFVEQVKKSRVVVVESIHSTSFFQSILYGVPTIIIENLDYRGLLNAEVLNLLEDLKKIDVWFEDASVAGKVINDNYEKIDYWWNKPERQTVIQNIQSKLWVTLDGQSEFDWWRDRLAKLI